ncbi:TonB-dependent receptor, partial [Allosphingosinicella sp.]|uniref:TonB-dependent receptor n=1 Tax=Allosphingosinicella sp. TaxID=2823234 RepID=UPI003D70517C
MALLAVTLPAPLFAQAQAPRADPPAPSDEEQAPAPAEPTAEEAAAAPLAVHDGEHEDDIVVTGQRLRGSVDSDIPPEVVLDPRDILATGANTIAGLLEAIAPQTRSARGRGGGGPALLLNGRRISNFSELRDLPPEAIERIDILSEEVGLRYGFRPDQRVVNIVLRSDFKAITGETGFGMATACGRTNYDVDVNVLRIAPEGRWSLDLEYRRSEALFESERDILQAQSPAPFALGGNIAGTGAGGEIDPALSSLAGRIVTVAAVPGTAGETAPTLGAFLIGADRPNLTDVGPFRTLLPQSQQLQLGGTINRDVFGDVSATLNARLELNSSESRFGLPATTLRLGPNNPFSPFGSDVLLLRSFEDPRPLTRENDGRTARLGFALNGNILPWRWSLTSSYENIRSLSSTDAGVDPGLVQLRLDQGDPGLNPFGPLPGNLLGARRRDTARSLNDSLDTQLVLSGPVLSLPAGKINATVRAGFDARGLDSRTVRGGAEQERSLSRERGSLQTSLDFPIASKRENVLSALGQLSGNFNA